MELYFIRHGRTPGNKEKRYIGRTDESILPESAADLRECAARGKYGYPEVLFVSPMKRCIETADIIYPGMEMHIIRDFRECDFGSFEGKNYRELSGNPDYQKWIDSGGTMSFPEGESMEEMTNRVMKGFYKALDVANGRDAAFVVHGGTIMAVMSRIDGGNFYDYQLDNGECLTFSIMV
ncbi:MAG: histidine phosphatase family protein [Lachnospiraceae bacterium]|nr:histidine phosphatase family protein [Lachnospiraceae bacterium]